MAEAPPLSPEATQIAVRPGPVGPAAGLPAGTRLNGTYEIDALIAIGGMGEVYRGHVIETDDQVAIKVVRPDMVGNEAALALFRKEASALHHLNHAVIIRYFVVAIDPELRRPYLAMEFVDGEPLSEILKRGPLTLPDCLHLLDRLASGLAAAHEIGIVHRDMSPDNIILPSGDIRRAKIIDFGIAKSTRLGAETVIGDSFAGKYGYVSPEQLGLYGGQITPKSDIYSLALVIAEASTGRPIDMGRNHAETIDRRRVVPPLDGVPLPLVPLLSGMLQPMPDDRPASMADVRLRAGDIGKAPEKVHSDEKMPASRPTPDLAENASEQRPARRRGQLSTLEAEQRSAVPRSRRLLVIAAIVSLVIGAAVPASLVWLPDLFGTRTILGELDGDPYLPLPKPGSLQAGKTPARLQAAIETPPEEEGAPQEPEEATPGTGKQQAATALPVLPPPPVIGSGPSVLPPMPPVETALARPPGPQGPAIVASQVPEIATPIQPVARQGMAEAFVAQYPVTPCFLASLRNAGPGNTGPGNADIEAFGIDARVAEAFDAGFTRALGFDAQIQFRPVSAAQCPAVEFLRKISGNQDRDVQLKLATLNPKTGQAMDGTIISAGFREITALLVSEDGVVQPLPTRARPGSRDSTISIPAMQAGRTKQSAALVIVILSPQKPRSLQGRARSFASEVFPALTVDLAPDQQGITVLRQYFRIEG